MPGPPPPAGPAKRPRPGRRLPRRLINLYAGLVLFGFSIALMLTSELGLDPWDVFHQGLAERAGLPIGLIVNGVGVVVLALWIPLRQRPGLGTISNVLVVGPAAQLALTVLDMLPEPRQLAVRGALLAAGILLNAIATGLYIGARLGPGPRDGLMTGLAERGVSVRVARTSIEVSVLAIGWLLGGTVGVGTVAYALTIGPLVHIFIPLFTVRRHGSPGPAAGAGADAPQAHRERPADAA